MKRGNEYEIVFTGLKDEIHSFTYKIGKPFFDLFEYSEISDAELDIILTLDKRETMMVASFNITGKITVSCDRCSDSMNLDIETSEELIYKFGEENLDDEKIVIVESNAISIDVKHPIYEFSVLQIPSRKVHDDGKCNKEMVAALDNYLMVEEPTEEEKSTEENNSNEEIDPRWNKLKKLK